MHIGLHVISAENHNELVQASLASMYLQGYKQSLLPRVS